MLPPGFLFNSSFHSISTLKLSLSLCPSFNFLFLSHAETHSDTGSRSSLAGQTLNPPSSPDRQTGKKRKKIYDSQQVQSSNQESTNTAQHPPTHNINKVKGVCYTYPITFLSPFGLQRLPRNLEPGPQTLFASTQATTTTATIHQPGSGIDFLSPSVCQPARRYRRHPAVNKVDPSAKG